MVKECKVILNNDCVTVVIVDGTKVQFPSIHREANTVFVRVENDTYTIVDGIDNTADEEKIEDVPKKKKRTKKTTVEEVTINEDM